MKTNGFRVGAFGCTCLFVQNAGRFPVDTKKSTVLYEVANIFSSAWHRVTPSCIVSGKKSKKVIEAPSRNSKQGKRLLGGVLVGNQLTQLLRA